MIFEAPAEKVKALVIPILSAEEVELVELNFRRQGHITLIEILVDKYWGGITLDDCTRLNQKIGDILDMENVFNEKYMLEVSSPGLDRPLKEKRDFSRVLNRPVRFILAQPVNDRFEYTGQVVKVQEDHVVVAFADGEVSIPLGSITTAKQMIKLNEY